MRFALRERSECFTVQRTTSCLRSKRFIDKHLVLWYNYQKGGNIMANNKVTEQSLDFAVHIINLVKQLKEQREKDRNA